MARKYLAECGYEGLANGIILQAASDYRTVLKKLKRNPANRDAVDEANQIEIFFRSQWYQMLTKVDGEYLIKRLRVEIDNQEVINNRRLA